MHLNAIIDQVEELQSNLQIGFTKGTSPLYAALLLTESIAEAQDRRIHLYAAFLDASKAFDVMWHNSMLKKLNDLGLRGVDWIMMQQWYMNMTSQVKWEGRLSEKFEEHQGVRQGGIWSPVAYKAFINPLLKIFEERSLGFKIGSIHVASPTCADYEILLSDNKYELMTLLKIQETYANKERYKLSEQNSKILIFNQNKKPHLEDGIWSLNDKKLEIVEHYTHIGIESVTDDHSFKHGCFLI